MSKEYWGFEKERGDTAFLAGIVDLSADELNAICDFGYAIDADIFRVEDNDTIPLDESLKKLNVSVKERLHYYTERYGIGASHEDIDLIDFQLEELHADNVNDYLCRSVASCSSSSQVSEVVDYFLDVLKYHMQSPLHIYEPASSDKNREIIGSNYMAMTWDYFFISYYDYFVLLIFGSQL